MKPALPIPDPWAAACPSREVLAMIGDKWALLLMPKLAGGPKRNGELVRALQGISQKMLTQTLRDMERNGLVTRRDFHEVPPRVEYELHSARPLARDRGVSARPLGGRKLPRGRARPGRVRQGGWSCVGELTGTPLGRQRRACIRRGVAGLS